MPGVILRAVLALSLALPALAHATDGVRVNGR